MAFSREVSGATRFCGDPASCPKQLPAKSTTAFFIWLITVRLPHLSAPNPYKTHMCGTGTRADATFASIAGVSTARTGPPGFDVPDGIDQWSALTKVASDEPLTEFPRTEVVLDMLVFGKLEKPQGKYISARSSTLLVCMHRLCDAPQQQWTSMIDLSWVYVIVCHSSCHPVRKLQAHCWGNRRDHSHRGPGVPLR